MFKGATKLDEQAVKEFAVAVEYLNTFLSASKYAAGDHLTIADIVLVASASTFEVCRMRQLASKFFFFFVFSHNLISLWT